jgi:hypothetical protein
MSWWYRLRCWWSRRCYNESAWRGCRCPRCGEWESDTTCLVYYGYCTPCRHREWRLELAEQHEYENRTRQPRSLYDHT